MRIQELDAFRGLAAMAVVLYHFTTRYSQIFNTETSLSFSYGWLGVPVFFILSGFVIHLTIDKCDSAKEFLIRRFFRLYPTYWIAVLCTLLVIVISGISSDFSFFQFSSLDVLMNFTMWHEFFGFHHVDGAYWSLLPELLFYLLMSFLFVVKSIDRYYLYNSALLLLCCVHYFFPLPIIGKILSLHYILLFMIGIAFYRLHTNRANFFEHIFIFLNLSIGVLLYNVAQPSVSVKLLFFLFFAVIILYYLFIYGKLKFLIAVKPLIFLGNISYALYLVHQNIGYVVIYQLEDIIGHFFSMIIAIAIAIFLAYIITYKIEPTFRKGLKKILLPNAK